MTVDDDKGLGCYQATEVAVTRLGVSVRQGEALDLAPLQHVVPELVSHLQDRDDLMVRALSGSGGSPLITNLIHVGILSIKLGMGLGYGRPELERLALAGLLHDIGIFAIPEAMLLKRESLSEDERQMLEQHPELGADLVRALGDEYEWLAMVIQQAHERWSGQGYPHGIKGDEIHEFAQVIGLADTFEAMVNPRPYQTRLFPQDAVRILLNESIPAFSRSLLKVLVKHLSSFPLGTTVRLNSGARGMVSKVNRLFPMRPVVELLDPADGPSGDATSTLDLSKMPLVHIVETIDPPTFDSTGINPLNSLTAHVGGLSSTEDISPLLEQLDAIACLMEGMVQPESLRTQLTPNTEPSPSSPEEGMQESGFGDSDFQEEVLELFSLESQEWVLQIQSALSELEANPPPELLPKIYDLLSRGLTNLGGSASIVSLPNIEQQAFSLLPLIQSFRDQTSSLTESQHSELRQRVTQLNDEVSSIAGTPPSYDQDDEEDEFDEEGGDEYWEESESTESSTDMEDDDESRSSQAEETSPEEVPPFPADSGQEDSTHEQHEEDAALEEVTLYAALRELSDNRKELLVSNRYVSAQILARVEEECVPSPESLDAETLLRFLNEHEQRDNEFFADFEGRLPPIMSALTVLREGSQEVVITEELLSPILSALQDLQSVAQRVEAGSLDPFITGLMTFLRVVAHRPVSSALPRLQAVDLRVQALRPMAQQWVEMGQVERTTIRQLLPEES